MKQQSVLARNFVKDLEHLSFGAPNGRFPGDQPLAATFHSATSSMLIDYTFVSLSLFSMITGFQLGTQDQSDHLPQEISTRIIGSPLDQPVEEPESIYMDNFRRIKFKTNQPDELLAPANSLWDQRDETDINEITHWEYFIKTLGAKHMASVPPASMTNRSLDKLSLITKTSNLRNLKKAINKTLCRLRHTGQDPSLQRDLAQLKAEKKKIIWQAKRNSDEKLWARLLHDSKSNNSARFWHTINSLASPNAKKINSHLAKAAWASHLLHHFNSDQKLITRYISEAIPSNQNVISGNEYFSFTTL